MLTPEYLEGVAEPLQGLYSELVSTIQQDIARRIAKAGNKLTETAAWQIYKLQELGESQKVIHAVIAKTLNLGNKEIKEIFKAAGIKSIKTDIELQKAAITAGKLPANVIPLRASAAMAQVLTANAIRTHNTLRNLTQTLAQDAGSALINYLDQAQLMVQYGAYTVPQAVETAVKKLAAEGVGFMDYDTGSKIRIDAGVRRAVTTGVNQAIGEISLNNAIELQTDLVEVTSHADSRPEHAVWQGGVYSISGTSTKYKGLREATGYGTGAGLCGWNCRHSFYAYIEGVSERVPKEEYNPATYQAEQEQRYYERMIRHWKRRAETMEAGGIDASKEKAKVREWQARQREHVKEHSLARQYSREQTYTALKQSDELKDYLTNIKPTLSKTSKSPDTMLQNTLEYPGMSGAIVPLNADLKNVTVIAGQNTITNINKVSRLVNEYGGEHWKWQKKAGIVESGYRKYEIHWFEYNGKQYESKIKGMKEK